MFSINTSLLFLLNICLLILTIHSSEQQSKNKLKKIQQSTEMTFEDAQKMEQQRALCKNFPGYECLYKLNNKQSDLTKKLTRKRRGWNLQYVNVKYPYYPSAASGRSDSFQKRNYDIISNEIPRFDIYPRRRF